MDILAKLRSNFVEGTDSREIFESFADQDGKLQPQGLIDLLGRVRPHVVLSDFDMFSSIGPIDYDAVRQKKDDTGAVILERIWPAKPDLPDHLAHHALSFPQFLCIFEAQKPDHQLAMCFGTLLKTYKQKQEYCEDMGSVTETEATTMVETYFKECDVREALNRMKRMKSDAGEQGERKIPFENFFEVIFSLWEAKRDEECKRK